MTRWKQAGIAAWFLVFLGFAGGMITCALDGTGVLGL